MWMRGTNRQVTEPLGPPLDALPRLLNVGCLGIAKEATGGCPSRLKSAGVAAGTLGIGWRWHGINSEARQRAMVARQR
ncbi:hypothetical protein NL676_024998 [Syzygium grande]|nr:hypothetical protein NL676_024998 [Syzygium grande]